MSTSRSQWIGKRGQLNADAAIGQVLDRQPGEQVQHLPDTQITDSPYQARRPFSDASVEDLAQGMRTMGFQGVLIVRPHGDLAKQRAGFYQLVYGHRRRAAWQRVCAERDECCLLPVIAREVSDDRIRAATPGGVQDQDFLLLENVPIWIGSVSRAKASPAVQEQIGYLRRYIIREVYAAFARGAGLPEGPSRRIEDLADLDRLDDAFTQLAEQQHTFEQSIAKDREQSQQELRQLVARVKALEERVGGTITREQRGYIYQLVQLWGTARARIERRTTSETMSACWGALKARYRLAKYDQLPIHLYDDCVQYVEQQYQRLTGEELRLPEQRDLGLE
jgi:hypothetical protein